MGCCLSTSIDSGANRVARWRSTGIVALRDAKLKVLFSFFLVLTFSLRLNQISVPCRNYLPGDRCERFGLIITRLLLGIR
jgi:hypothetical protein